ncbi:MAG TPA: DUF559 domain-containing protein, partial [Solirubrobacteraceae bacterium]|nr:DUF559 domain-containing protein [Solirubrobacteraceae bacterium]
DVVFDAEKLIVELDGWIFHRGRKSHDENRERDTHLKDHGYDTIRITSKRLGEREAARLHRILRDQRWLVTRSAAGRDQADPVGRGWARGSAAPGQGQDPDRDWEAPGSALQGREGLNHS